MGRALLLNITSTLNFVKMFRILFVFKTLLQTDIFCLKRQMFGPQLDNCVLRIFLFAFNFSGFSPLKFSFEKDCERCYKLKKLPFKS